ncbi:hypothetical protein I9453_01965 [Campylobacter coli]|nr:hypothetical protein [Campylobacter coli]
MNIVDLVKTIENIENPQNLKITREGACFYMCLGENKKYFYQFPSKKTSASISGR